MLFKMGSWLEKYIKGLHEEAHEKLTILELGCGRGNDTIFLSSTGHRIISCDIAEDQLEIIKVSYPGVETVCFDLREHFPFGPDMADIVIAGLCLHFFTEKEQKHMLAEISRVMKDGGRFLCRLNSDKGRIPDVQGETALGSGYYITKGGLKRFYNEEMIRATFSDWNVLYIDEYETETYTKRNTVFELELSL